MTSPDPDAQALQEVLCAVLRGMGRGGLTYIATRLGMTPSAMRKRLRSPNAFDGPSLLALIFLQQTSTPPANGKPKRKKKVGNYLIAVHDVDGVEVPSWSEK